MAVTTVNLWTPRRALRAPRPAHRPRAHRAPAHAPRELGGEAPALSALDYVLVAVVALGFLAFEIWFLFFSSSPLDGRTGRS